MMANHTRRATLRATLPLAALLLTGCASSSFGPAATREGTSRLQPLLTPEDGPLELAVAATWLNMRLFPSFADSLLLGARAEPVTGVVAFTERSLIGANWTNETRGYALSFRIPYREIVAVAPFGPRADIFGNRLGIINIETNVPRHTPLGQPPRTGLYRIFPEAPEQLDMLLETLRARAPQAGTNPQ